MLKTVKARFINGALVPIENLDLKEGDEVLVTVDTKTAVSAMSAEEMTERSKAAAGGWLRPDWTPTTEAEIKEAEAAAEEMNRFIYQARHRGIDCDCIYCAPKT